MMADEEQAEDLFSEEESQFLVNSDAEVAYILSRAQEKSALVTVYFNAGRDFAITSILAVRVDTDQIIFDAPARPELVARLVASRRIVFVTMQDGVKIKFAVGGAWQTTFEDHPALAAEMPRALVRLQRREFFRVPCPVTNPVRCTIPGPANGGVDDITVTFVDISLGGAAISGSDRLDPAQGTVFHKCRIDFPDGETITADLEVRNCYVMPLRNGGTTKRFGCMFLKLPPAAQTALQRFIMKLERERNARYSRG
jgi:flagellar brake protein